MTGQDFPIDWNNQLPHVPHLEATVTITGHAGVKGTLQVFGIRTDHFGVRNDTMAPLIANGAGGAPQIFTPKSP